MTSPDERFDDAFRSERISRGLWQFQPPIPFSDKTRKVFAEEFTRNAKCAHCGVMRLQYSIDGVHICIVAPYDFLGEPGDPYEVIRLFRIQAGL